MTLTLLDAVASTSASAVRPMLSDRKLFTLVYVGDATPRPASDDEAAALGTALACELALPMPAARSAAGQPASCTRADSSPTQHTPHPAGPCLHCGATESPQWRKGPAAKPVLCNACGTRFRRTSQLNIGRPVLGPARTGPARKRCAEQGVHNTQGVKSARQAYVA